ncbi:MAG TPA: trypsin-like peptidase domain-containing protein [Chitinophagaceae bacterium]
MNFKNILAVVAISASTTVASVWGYNKIQESRYAGTQQEGKLPVNYAGFFGNDNNASPVVDFTPAATAATPAVVHIKTVTKAKQVNGQRQRSPFSDFFGDDMFDDFFGGPRVYSVPEQRASGSGVIYTADGYIITNNHVVAGADEINVTLKNRRTYKATVVGTDPSSDLAVIKIDEKNLPYIIWGNSDEVKLGQWVLAIGYPLNLDVTVTAGIVSAKARAIGINNRQSENPVESFIQTDAAVNQGNSGGALINTDGQLIGINSAIASPTGTYAGYSYAIPVNIVKKAVADIVKYGTVQRAYIGISYPRENLNDEQKEKLGIKEGPGVYVTDVSADGAAKSAGIQPGDIITKINDRPVSSGPEMVEQVANYRPGDKITVTFLRNNKEQTVNLTLKNKAGTFDLVKAESALDRLGGELVTVDAAVARKNSIDGGVSVKKIGTSGALAGSRIQEGFIIISVNGKPVKTVEDLASALASIRGTAFFEGIYPGFPDETYRYPVTITSE